VVGAVGVGGAVADADRGVQGEGVAEGDAAADLDAAEGAVGAGELVALVEAEAGGARGLGALDDVGGEEALVDEREEDGLAGAGLGLSRRPGGGRLRAGLALGDEEGVTAGEVLEAEAGAASGGAEAADAADLEALGDPAGEDDGAAGGAVGVVGERAQTSRAPSLDVPKDRSSGVRGRGQGRVGSSAGRAGAGCSRGGRPAARPVAVEAGDRAGETRDPGGGRGSRPRRRGRRSRAPGRSGGRARGRGGRRRARGRGGRRGAWRVGVGARSGGVAGGRRCDQRWRWSSSR
jgi:hypothetical protein